LCVNEQFDGKNEGGREGGKAWETVQTHGSREAIDTQGRQGHERDQCALEAERRRACKGAKVFENICMGERYDRNALRRTAAKGVLSTKALS
jgi:hypothetical protein